MDNLDFSSLSDREQEILELAIEGLTDQQIGNRIDISASTVNSYWVRIRGKLGHLSRTELVSRILQQRALRENQILNSRIQELEAELMVSRQGEWNSHNANVLRAAFESLPEATLILDADCSILFASQRAEELFGFARNELEGRPIYDLIKSGDAYAVNICDAVTGAEVQRHGVDRVVYGRDKGGRLFRVMLLTAPGEAAGKPIYSCLVRPFAEEVDLLRRRASAVIGSI